LKDRLQIRLGHSLSAVRPTLHNGPGWRLGIWTQGCSIRCTDRCLSPHLLPTTGGALRQISRVAEWIDEILADDPRPVEGVTVLGGEPFDQAPAVAALLAEARARRLSTMVYTGYRLEDLEASSEAEVRTLLGLTDLLVDGPFESDCYDDRLAWRGSRNQRLITLSKRYDSASLQRAFEAQGKGWSISGSASGGLSMSGLQDRAGAERAETALRRGGDRRARPRGGERR
jgi:anaerobic ribonucleoside-triphosphate reductase activating protein